MGALPTNSDALSTDPVPDFPSSRRNPEFPTPRGRGGGVGVAAGLGEGWATLRPSPAGQEPAPGLEFLLGTAERREEGGCHRPGSTWPCVCTPLLTVQSGRGPKPGSRGTLGAPRRPRGLRGRPNWCAPRGGGVLGSVRGALSHGMLLFLHTNQGLVVGRSGGSLEGGGILRNEAARAGQEGNTSAYLHGGKPCRESMASPCLQVRNSPVPSRASQGRPTHRSRPPRTRPDEAPAAGDPLPAPGRGAFSPHPHHPTTVGAVPGHQGRKCARSSGAGGRACSNGASFRLRRWSMAETNPTRLTSHPRSFAHYHLLLESITL